MLMIKILFSYCLEIISFKIKIYAFVNTKAMHSLIITTLNIK